MDNTAEKSRMEELEQILNDLVHKIAKEQNFTDAKVDITKTTSDGANYTSKLYLATISQEGLDELKLFAKVANVGEKMRAMAPFHLFDTEIFFYTDLIKTYRDLEEKHNVPVENRLITAKFFGCNPEYLNEILVWEDLTVKGFQMFDRFTTFDWPYASETMTQLAKLHSLSIAYSIQQPENFLKDKDFLKVTHDVERMKGFMETIIAKVIAVAKDEHKDKIRNFIDTTATPDNFQRLMGPIKIGVLTHSDFRASNLMHRVNKDGSVNVIPIDYQTLQHSNPIVDIMYFIFTGSDQSFRKKHYRQLLDLYYEELSSSLRRLGVDPDVVYAREDFEYELKEVLPYGLLISFMLLMMVTVDVEDAPVITENSDLHAFLITPNELYKKRITEVIEDFIDMGVL